MRNHPHDAERGPARPLPFGPPHRFVDVGTARLATWRIGRGPDVVLVHGWPLHCATFRHVVPALCRHHTLHLVDLPGAGESEWDRDAPLDLHTTARALLRVIDALGLGRFAYLAHDSGGLVARLAAAGDERVSGLVLGNTEIPGHTPWLVAAYAALARVPGARRALLGAMRVGAIRRSFLGFGGCFEDPAWVEGDFRALFVDPLVAGGKASAGALGLLTTLDASVHTALAAAHPRIAAPVRMIWGADDPFFPLDRARAMATSFPGGAEIAVIPGAKLFAHEDHADEFAAHAAEALRSFDTEAAATGATPAVLDG